jgi:acid stress-induced BolA-like protein IbaG/YrbA
VAGENCSFEVNVTSPTFADMSSLQRQRSILTLFNTEIASGELHALTVKAKTPQELPRD